jgi:hypothetical protein
MMSGIVGERDRDQKALHRALRLLAALATLHKCEVDEVVCEVVPEYFDVPDGLDTDDRYSAWGEASSETRELVKLALQEDILKLSAMGFGVEWSSRGQPTAELYTEFLTLTEQPFVPVALDPKDVPTAISLAALSMLESDEALDPPDRALVFGKAATERVLVDMVAPDRPDIRVVPVKTVLRQNGRWYGLGLAADSRRALTFRLGPDGTAGSNRTPVPTSEAIPEWAATSIDTDRLLNPLTWGASSQRVLIDVEPAAAERFVSMLGVAVTDVADLGGTMSIAVDVTSLPELARTLAPFVSGIRGVSPAPAEDALVSHLRSVAADADWVPTDVIALDARLRPQEAVRLEPPSATELLPVSAAAPDGQKGTVRNKIGAVLLMLRALEQADRMTIHELMAVSGLKRPAAEKAIVAYVEAESDLANEMRRRSVEYRPLLIERDTSGRVVAVYYDPDVEGPRESIRNFGRREMSVAELVRALAVGLDVLAYERDGMDLDRVRRFVASAADALGVALDALDVAIPPKSAAADFEAVLESALAEMSPITFWYDNPWTLGSGERTVLPMERRRVGRQSLIEAIDLGPVPEDSPHRLRTFALAGMSRVRPADDSSATAREAIGAASPRGGKTSSEVTVTLVVAPDSRRAEQLKGRWHARTLRRDDGVVVAEVDLSEPVVERLAQLLLENGGDVRVLFPEDLREVGPQRARQALATLGGGSP